ncbi:hypothetical protein C7M84_018849 [Penaeus vannamei]|uniref:Uncharacterized protein n=1 Tax=Penaeus vannamei TaxID=6689 RepID=A0A3R7LSJ4_PENVA|nr:hypothetical protein C7M84_018849 [Penaeus vannamei]
MSQLISSPSSLYSTFPIRTSFFFPFPILLFYLFPTSFFLSILFLIYTLLSFPFPILPPPSPSPSFSRSPLLSLLDSLLPSLHFLCFRCPLPAPVLLFTFPTFLAPFPFPIVLVFSIPSSALLSPISFHPFSSLPSFKFSSSSFSFPLCYPPSRFPTSSSQSFLSSFLLTEGKVSFLFHLSFFLSCISSYCPSYFRLLSRPSSFFQSFLLSYLLLPSFLIFALFRLAVSLPFSTLPSLSQPFFASIFLPSYPHPPLFTFLPFRIILPPSLAPRRIIPRSSSMSSSLALSHILSSSLSPSYMLSLSLFHLPFSLSATILPPRHFLYPRSSLLFPSSFPFIILPPPLLPLPCSSFPTWAPALYQPPPPLQLARSPSTGGSLAVVALWLLPPHPSRSPARLAQSSRLRSAPPILSSSPVSPLPTLLQLDSLLLTGTTPPRS